METQLQWPPEVHSPLRHPQSAPARLLRRQGAGRSATSSHTSASKTGHPSTRAIFSTLLTASCSHGSTVMLAAAHSRTARAMATTATMKTGGNPSHPTRRKLDPHPHPHLRARLRHRHARATRSLTSGIATTQASRTSTSASTTRPTASVAISASPAACYQRTHSRPGITPSTRAQIW